MKNVILPKTTRSLNYFYFFIDTFCCLLERNLNSSFFCSSKAKRRKVFKGWKSTSSGSRSFSKAFSKLSKNISKQFLGIHISLKYDKKNGGIRTWKYTNLKCNLNVSKLIEGFTLYSHLKFPCLPCWEKGFCCCWKPLLKPLDVAPPKESYSARFCSSLKTSYASDASYKKEWD